MPPSFSSTAWDLSEPELRAFHARLHRERETMNLSIQEMLGASIIVSLRLGNEIAAVAGVRRVKFFPVAFFVVLQQYQGQGLGKQLIATLHEKLASEGKGFVCISVLKRNTLARKLYRNFGYHTFFMNRHSLYMIHFL